MHYRFQDVSPNRTEWGGIAKRGKGRGAEEGCLICSTSTILGTNGLNSADVPLSNKQTNKQTNKLGWRIRPPHSPDWPSWFARVASHDIWRIAICKCCLCTLLISNNTFLICTCRRWHGSSNWRQGSIHEAETSYDLGTPPWTSRRRLVQCLAQLTRDWL